LALVMTSLGALLASLNMNTLVITLPPFLRSLHTGASMWSRCCCRSCPRRGQWSSAPDGSAWPKTLVNRGICALHRGGRGGRFGGHPAASDHIAVFSPAAAVRRCAPTPPPSPPTHSPPRARSRSRHPRNGDRGWLSHRPRPRRPADIDQLAVGVLVQRATRCRRHCGVGDRSA
jgi:hypothetical protein